MEVEDYFVGLLLVALQHFLDLQHYVGCFVALVAVDVFALVVDVDVLVAAAYCL